MYPCESEHPIGSAVFARLTNMTNRRTNRHVDHATLSVAIGRIYAQSSCDVVL